MDKNRDGMLSADEMVSHKKHQPRFGKKIFSRLDANGDGQVSKEESQAAWGEWFKRLDTNADQVVSSEEVKQARSKWQK
jgi:Ca2+-binding EF-hand superfamily protein